MMYRLVTPFPRLVPIAGAAATDEPRDVDLDLVRDRSGPLDGFHPLDVRTCRREATYTWTLEDKTIRDSLSGQDPHTYFQASPTMTTLSTLAPGTYPEGAPPDATDADVRSHQPIYQGRDRDGQPRPTRIGR